MSTKPSLPSGDAQFGFAVIQITRDEYTSLVKTAQQYDTLCRNLINGGVQRETIELLSLQTSNGPEPRVEKSSFHAPMTNTSCSDHMEQHHIPTTSYQTSHADPYRFVAYPNSRRTPSTADGTESDDLELVDDSSTDSEIEKSSTIDNQVPALFNGSSTPAVRKNATRTVQLINLAEGTTLANITSVVKGGFLVNIYSRLRDNMASLSFLHSSDAHAFYSYVQANGLYINNKKVVPVFQHCSALPETDRILLLGRH
ncbi:hypothetical protein VFPPC_17723 [Pochonia chlamydosporia 170]|uniref:RNA recognition motif domain-containing protein n=1 Tax=Pochonia chlamydosporia 170 TaxID=1380566 RepID=A0A219AQS7_METCM|nr:hypothetical protein VFPPC_17723 [Pochonia chlamydosporia 170]OWT43101.1 hypothetical protein VFPPC_17723 [Pochonia chlamydosporia 170]